jgi:hypothetical protein
MAVRRDGGGRFDHVDAESANLANARSGTRVATRILLLAHPTAVRFFFSTSSNGRVWAVAGTLTFLP